MKYLQIIWTFIVLNVLGGSLSASSITAYNNQTAYETNNHVFRNNEIAQGFVRLNEGFTVMPGSCVNMDVLFTVSGDIDLRETSTIRLLKDLKFDSGVTLTTGGNIDGRGHTLSLNSDFRIPAGKVLHFNGDTILDARGNEIIIGENAEIFVDTNVTLTIANATIKTTRNAPWFPALRCGALTSKLALDNVVLIPADDFLFLGGQLYIHNDVAITGTSSFIYNSPAPSFITKNSCLYLDHAVTFSMAPATFTDAPYSLKNTYTNNNFIKMADETSVLYLDGCTLQTTFTGWRLTKGTVTFDNCVNCVPDPTLTLTSFSYRAGTTAGTLVFESSWHPGGKYLLISSDEPKIRVLSFDGVTITAVTQFTPTAMAYKALWSPDGNYVAASGNLVTGYIPLFVCKFNGTSLTLSSNYTANMGDIAWSPDGKYIAAENGSSLLIYRFDGTSLSVVQQVTPGDTSSVAWSSDGTHIALGQVSGIIRIYAFEGTSLTEVVTANANVGSGFVAWSPDGRYLLAAYLTYSNQLQLYRFDGNSLTFVDQKSYGDANSIYGIKWSPDGRYITFSLDLYGQVKTYAFDGYTMEEIASPIFYVYPFENPFGVAWHPSMKYLAVNAYSSLYQSTIYDIHYAPTTTPQALSASMVFGDSAKGSACDAYLRLQPGASINLTGKMLYDNVN